MQAGERVEHALLVLRQHPAQVLLLAHLRPVGRRHRREPDGRVGVGAGAIEGGLDVVREVTRTVDPEVEVLVQGDVERRSDIDQVLQAGRLLGDATEGDGLARLPVEGGEQHVGEVAAGITRADVDLQAEHDRAVTAHEGRPRHRQHRRQGDIPPRVLPGERELRRGSGHDLAHRDDVALGDHALEGTRRADEHRGGRLAVAGLVATARPARAGLAHADDGDVRIGDRGSGRSRTILLGHGRKPTRPWDRAEACGRQRPRRRRT